MSLTSAAIGAPLGRGADLPRVGLLVPPRNVTVEVEVATLLADRARVVTRGLRADGLARLEDRLAAYVDDVPTRLHELALAAPAAVLVACTASFYDWSMDEVRAWEAARSEEAGRPVLTPVTAIADALGVVRARRPLLMSPYPPALTARAAEFWTRAGHPPAHVVRVGEGDPYAVGADEVVAAAAGAADADAVLLSGTGMATLGLLPRLARPGRPVITSNWASAWRLGQHADLPGAGAR